MSGSPVDMVPYEVKTLWNAMVSIVKKNHTVPKLSPKDNDGNLLNISWIKLFERNY